MIILKIKMPDLINDYLIDIKKYYKKIKKTIKKVYREFRYHWKNPQSKIGKKIVTSGKITFQQIRQAGNHKKSQ